MWSYNCKADYLFSNHQKHKIQLKTLFMKILVTWRLHIQVSSNITSHSSNSTTSKVNFLLRWEKCCSWTWYQCDRLSELWGSCIRNAQFQQTMRLFTSFIANVKVGILRRKFRSLSIYKTCSQSLYVHNKWRIYSAKNVQILFITMYNLSQSHSNYFASVAFIVAREIKYLTFTLFCRIQNTFFDRFNIG